jgi:hypothetical protein
LTGGSWLVWIEGDVNSLFSTALKQKVAVALHDLAFEQYLPRKRMLKELRLGDDHVFYEMSRGINDGETRQRFCGSWPNVRGRLEVIGQFNGGPGSAEDP